MPRYDKPMKKIAIIGGGAAGLAAAVAAAQKVDGQAVEIVVFESADRVGKSILATGNGRCNFSNARIETSKYYQSAFVEKAFQELSPTTVLEWFAQLGLMWAEESEGRLYPATFKATTVLDVLRMSMRELPIVQEASKEVHTITPVGKQFLLTFEDSQTAFFDKVIVAVGKYAARSLIPVAHDFNNTDPVLCPLQTKTQDIKALDTIRVRAKVTFGDFHEEGEVLFRTYGVSGVVIFNASRYAYQDDELLLDLMPQKTTEEIESFLRAMQKRYPARSLFDLCVGLVNSRVMGAVGKQAGIDATTQATLEHMSKLAYALKHFKLTVTGKGDPSQAQVMRGGFSVEDFNAKTLQSKHTPGLFVVGEALDVDGPCGGYNLHWAWTSGVIAGRAAVAGVEA